MKIDAEKLKMKLAQQALNVTEFAQKANLSIVTVSRAINHDLNCNFRTIGRLCAVLDCKPAEITKT